MSVKKIKARGFSLLETLIASGILIAVILGTTSLSNALVVGTIVNADKTIINRWAAEGIELTQKIRDDTILNKSTVPNWFAPAVTDNGSDYGWYKLKAQTRPSNTWALIKIAGNVNKLSPTEFTSGAMSEKLSSDKLTGFRLVCVESVAASSISNAGDVFQCNSNSAGSVISDGLRTNLSSCESSDYYCKLTTASVRKNRLNSKLTIT